MKSKKSKLSFEAHLVIRETVLAPGAEWAIQSPGWSFLQVTRGAAYWLHPRMNHDLTTGSVLVLPQNARGLVRASQIEAVQIHYFRLQPARLTGLLSLGEQQFLQGATAQDGLSVRLFAPSAPVSQKFKALCEKPNASLNLRLDLLCLFIAVFADELANQVTPGDGMNDAKTRLVKLLEDKPAADLLDLSFADLVRETRCTPRHLSRIFHQVVGMSFREKQAQVRLLRAQELLATTTSKVVEVALESGYPSLSLFNLMFKRRFGTTPARWREQIKEVPRTRGFANRAAILRA